MHITTKYNNVSFTMNGETTEIDNEHFTVVGTFDTYSDFLTGMDWIKSYSDTSEKCYVASISVDDVNKMVIYPNCRLQNYEFNNLDKEDKCTDIASFTIFFGKTS